MIKNLQTFLFSILNLCKDFSLVEVWYLISNGSTCVLTSVLKPTPRELSECYNHVIMNRVWSVSKEITIITDFEIPYMILCTGL